MRKKVLGIAIFAAVCCVAFLFYRRVNERSDLIQVPSRVYEPSTALSPQETFIGEKLTLQVHSAAFNIPIAVKDLLLQPDR
jgi:hypothetical protein